MYLYWGDQRQTAGPVYIGAVAVFLFVLGLFLLRGPVKWWLAGLTLLAVLLAWGRNFLFLSEWFINYFPLYNKFRVVSMILVIAELTIPLLGILALKEWIAGESTPEQKKKALTYALGIAGGFALFFTLLPGAFFSFESPMDSGLPEWLTAALHADRQSLLRNDALRSLIFVALTAGLLWAFFKNKIKAGHVCVLLSLLALADMWPVNKRYINNDHFVTRREVREPIKATAADLQILQDKDPNYRVLNLTVDPFNDATTSYFHKSIGGYHGAKMERFQEIIEHQIAKNNMGVLNMLNTKYLIVPDEQGNPVASRNPGALGAAWTVDTLLMADNADQEMAALTNLNPAVQAVVDRRFAQNLQGFSPNADSTASVQLTSYQPNELTYSFTSKNPECVVFSEIYYPEGWKAYLDGEEAPHFRANYILRAMIVPAGNHQIVFRFKPMHYFMGERIALAGSVLLVVLLCTSILAESGALRAKKPKDSVSS